MTTGSGGKSPANGLVWADCCTPGREAPAATSPIPDAFAGQTHATRRALFTSPLGAQRDRRYRTSSRPVNTRSSGSQESQQAYRELKRIQNTL